MIFGKRKKEQQKEIAPSDHSEAIWVNPISELVKCLEELQKNPSDEEADEKEWRKIEEGIARLETERRDLKREVEKLKEEIETVKKQRNKIYSDDVHECINKYLRQHLSYQESCIKTLEDFQMDSSKWESLQKQHNKWLKTSTDDSASVPS